MQFGKQNPDKFVCIFFLFCMQCCALILEPVVLCMLQVWTMLIRLGVIMRQCTHPLGERKECRREAREAEDGVVQAPRRRVGRPRRAVVEDEPQPQADPDYEEMGVEHQLEEDVEKDAQQQRWRRGKKVAEPDPDPLDDYPGGPHDITMLMRYHVHVAKKASEGVVRINVIF